MSHTHTYNTDNGQVFLLEILKMIELFLRLIFARLDIAQYESERIQRKGKKNECKRNEIAEPKRKKTKRNGNTTEYIIKGPEGKNTDRNGTVFLPCS